MMIAEPKKIAFFVPSLRGGGAEKATVTLANEFAKRGLRVDLLLAQAEGPYMQDVSVDVRVVDLGSSRVATCIPKLAGYFRRDKPDALISALNHANVAAIICHRLAGSKARLVVCEHTTPSRSRTQNLRGRVIIRLLGLFYPMADTVVTVSEGAKADLTLLGVRASQIRVVPNPVLTADFYKNAQEVCSHPWLSPNMPPVIISSGRLEKAKDFHTLIRAFSILRSKRDAKLIILGEGSERDSLKQLVSSLDLNEHVDLHGFVDNPHKYINRAKVFALSSAWEGLPTVLIEALACGVAIVSTDCKSGPREILLDGRLGALVPVGAVKSLSEALEVALIAPSIPAAEKCLGRFSVETSVNQYMAVVGAHNHAPS